MSDLALDTSAAVALLLRSHMAHDVVRAAVSKRRLALTGQSLAETFSVLTRLPGDARLAPLDAARLLDENFDEVVVLEAKTTARLPSLLAPLGVAGGAVYDALVGLAASQAELPLATRDQRAAATYAAVRAEVELISDA